MATSSESKPNVPPKEEKTDEDVDVTEDGDDDKKEIMEAFGKGLITPYDRDNEMPDRLDNLIASLSKTMESALQLKAHLADRSFKDPGLVHTHTYAHVHSLRERLTAATEVHAQSKGLSIFNAQLPGFIGWDHTQDLPEDIKKLLPYYSRWDCAYFLSESATAANFMDYNAGSAHVPAETAELPNEIACKYGFPYGCFLHITRMS
ncbi:MAG: hypothetical protein Harvfovirus3_75 [Harvfovirus sp.]|uniref:Uncharacterized protein n=1 Tax=Harvfovirus sp. TaxID=2487768 RepID=A0A3G5A0H2_9VIRU|nr:MAG: hypothetical protein Harvfovirus3_75 [Harvfovirus sp.]